MKKSILVAIAIFAVLAGSAQVDRNAIGLRLGGGNTYGGELSYQLGLSDSKRLEFDLGFANSNNYNVVGLAGIYQWVWPIGSQGFNWFAGPGAGVSLNSGKKNNDDFFGLAVGGQVGVGYNFNIPLGLTLDARPMWDLLADNDAFGWHIALGIRYRF